MVFGQYRILEIRTLFTLYKIFYYLRTIQRFSLLWANCEGKRIVKWTNSREDVKRPPTCAQHYMMVDWLGTLMVSPITNCNLQIQNLRLFPGGILSFLACLSHDVYTRKPVTTRAACTVFFFLHAGNSFCLPINIGFHLQAAGVSSPAGPSKFKITFNQSNQPRDRHVSELIDQNFV